VLQCVAVCCSVLQCVASVFRESSSVLQCIAVRCSALQCVAVCCSVLQCVARVFRESNSVLQCVAVRCKCLSRIKQCVAVRCSVLQCVAVRCKCLSRMSVYCALEGPGTTATCHLARSRNFLKQWALWQFCTLNFVASWLLRIFKRDQAYLRAIQQFELSQKISSWIAKFVANSFSSKKVPLFTRTSRNKWKGKQKCCWVLMQKVE